MFDPGAICLELAVTGGEGDRAAYETLNRPTDLDRWLASFLGVEVQATTDADLASTKRLREAIWRCVEARAEGRPLPRASVEDVNRAAAQQALAPQFDSADRHTWAEPVTSGQVLSTLARDLIDVLTGPRAERVRRCAGTNCVLLFVDASPAGHRRWCSMQRCGNRAKVSAFRTRQRREQSP